MNKTTLKFGGYLTATAVLLILGLAGPATARESLNDQSACQLYRGDSSLESLKQRETQLKEEFLISPDTGGDYCEMANIHYKLARLVPDRQVSYLNSCIEFSDKAILRNSNAGAAYFFKGLCLGRLGELKGVWGSLKIIAPFRKNMETAAHIDPALDRGGPHRALGRLYFELPMVLGGDIKKSIGHLLKAVTYGPQYWENHFFLAESYFENHQYLLARAELQRAIEITSKLDDDPENKTRKVKFRGLMQAIENHIH